MVHAIAHVALDTRLRGGGAHPKPPALRREARCRKAHGGQTRDDGQTRHVSRHPLDHILEKGRPVMMPAALPLRAALLRGALITLANWPVVLIDFAIESLYKLVLVVPVVGGALVAAVLAASDLRSLFAGG